MDLRDDDEDEYDDADDSLVRLYHPVSEGRPEVSGARSITAVPINTSGDDEGDDDACSADDDDDDDDSKDAEKDEDECPSASACGRCHTCTNTRALASCLHSPRRANRWATARRARERAKRGEAVATQTADEWTADDGADDDGVADAEDNDADEEDNGGNVESPPSSQNTAYALGKKAAPSSPS